MTAVAMPAAGADLVRSFLGRLETTPVPQSHDDTRETRVELGGIVVRREQHTAKAVLDVVSTAFGIPIDELRSRYSLTLARHVAMYLLHEYARLSYPEVAAAVAVGNHTGARYGVVAVTDRMQADESFARAIAGLLEALRTGSAPPVMVLVRAGAQPRAARPAPSMVSGELLDRIIDACAFVFDVAREEILSDRRDAEITVARHACMYLAWRYTDLSMTQIARRMRRRDHTTVMHARDRIQATLPACDRAAQRIAREVQRAEELALSHEPIASPAPLHEAPRHQRKIA